MSRESAERLRKLAIELSENRPPLRSDLAKRDLDEAIKRLNLAAIAEELDLRGNEVDLNGVW